MSFLAKEHATQVIETVESVEPPFIGFPEKIEARLRDIAAHIHLPLGHLSGIRYVEDPDMAKVAVAMYDLLTNEITINGPFGDGPEEIYRLTFGFARTFFHELGHGIIDPSAYVVRDENGRPVLDANGALQFDQALFDLYHTENFSEIERLVIPLMYSAAMQAHRTRTYIDAYQTGISLARWSLEGQARGYAGMIYTLSDTIPEDEKLIGELEAKADKTEADVTALNRLKEDLPKKVARLALLIQLLDINIDSQIELLGAFFGETFGIIMENALLNPKNLQDKTEAQRAVWEREGVATEHQTLGVGGKLEFVETAVIAEELLQRVYNIDAKGLERRRRDLKKFLLKTAEADAQKLLDAQE